MSYDWTKFECHIFIKAPIEKIFNAWMSEKEITTWFLEKTKLNDKNGRQRSPEEHCEVGDTYEWKWYGWDYLEKGRITAVEKNKSIAFTFSHDSVNVELQFIDHMNEVQCILTQTDIPTDEKNMVNVHMGCNLGWSFWFVNLKAWLEYGVLLNDKTHREPHAINQ